MKCIQFTHGAVRFGMVVRICDADAEEFVRQGQAIYVPRKMWKESGRQYWLE